jgi:hypothetical protein
MNITTATVDHLVGLDGTDHGPAVIEIGPSGDVLAVRLQHDARPATAPEVTALPLLADSHAHLAISDGVTDDISFHALDRVDAQLRHLAVRGIGHVHSLGTDQPWLQDRLRRRLDSGDAGEKAFGYSAGVGFGAVDGWPPELTSPEPRFRPEEPDVARHQVRQLAGLGCRTLKIWVDDFGGSVPKVPLDIVQAIVDEARQCGMASFAHVFFHDDAEALVACGIDVLAHSVRDKIIDDALIGAMLDHGTTLVPTLSREESELEFSNTDNAYMDDGFFLSSESDLIPRLRGKKYSDDPHTPKRRLEIALENVARVHAAGVPISLGTDSGFKMKLLGFAQHRELQLLNKAGLSPAECLKAALQTNQRLFAIGMTAIAPDQRASFFVVEGNPLTDISATVNIREVWVCGQRLSGPDVDLTDRPSVPVSAGEFSES